MTFMAWIYLASAGVLSFSIGYKIGFIRGTKQLGAILRRTGSALADRI